MSRVRVWDAAISDHLVMESAVLYASNEPEVHVSFYRQLHTVDTGLFQRDLEMLPLDELLLADSIDDKVQILNSDILSVADIHCPTRVSKPRRLKPFIPWLTNNVKFMMPLRNKALSRFLNVYEK